MDLIRDIEDSDDELIVRGSEGSGTVLFYTGLTGLVAGAGFALFDLQLGQVAIVLSVVVTIVGYLLARRQTSLEVDHTANMIATKDNRWDLEDAVAVVLSPRLRVPSHIDDPSLVTEDTGEKLWRAWLFAANNVRDRNKLLAKLEDLIEDGDTLHVLELDDRLEALDGEVFMQMPGAENPAVAALRAAKHLDVPLLDFALGAAPRQLEPDSLTIDALRTSARQLHGAS